MSRVPSKPLTIVIDGKRHLWRDILEKRRRQLGDVPGDVEKEGAALLALSG